MGQKFKGTDVYEVRVKDFFIPRKLLCNAVYYAGEDVVITMKFPKHLLLGVKKIPASVEVK